MRRGDPRGEPVVRDADAAGQAEGLDDLEQPIAVARAARLARDLAVQREVRTARANPTLSTGTITVICAAGSAAGSGSMNGNGRGAPTADAQPTLRINTSTAPPASPAYAGP